MKLFGSKNDDGQDNSFSDEMTDEGFDTAEVDLDAEEGDSLSAPSRDIAEVAEGRRGGGAKRALLLGGVALLLAGGAGGAYYYYTNMMDVPPPPRVAKKAKAPVDTAQNAPVPMPIDVTSDVLGAGVPPMPQAALDDPLQAPAAPAPIELNADFTSGAPAVTAEVPAQAAALTDAPVDPFTAAAMPDDAIPAAPAEPAAPAAPAVTDVLAELGAPPAADDAVPAIPADALAGNAPDMPADVLGDAFAPMNTAPENQTAAQPPKEDLPMPNMTASPAAAPVPADPAGAVAGATTAENAAPAAAPSNAEKAIVENAAMLDQLSAPAPGTAADPAARGKTVTEILGKPAIVRPMPDSYVIVRKEKDGGALDSRLKIARSALVQNRDMAALQLFNELHADYPRDNRVAMGRALAMQKLGQYDQALEAYEGVLANDPKNLEALTNMLGILKRQNPALALEKLEELRNAYPFNADIVAQLGVAHAGMKSYAEALKYLDMAEALRPGNGYVLFNKAVLFDRMGREQEASALYRQLVRMAAEGVLNDPVPLDAVRHRLSTMRQ